MGKHEHIFLDKNLRTSKDWVYIFIALAVIWTIIVALSLTKDLIQQDKYAHKTARIRAIEALNKDLVYRRWVAGQGGVYVPVSTHTPPNPHLSHIKERDLTTLSGKKLTLVNPAYMTRQVHELGAEKYKVRGHITSLNPLRPENKPDQWETDALKEFEKGAKEVSSVDLIDNEPYIRFMIPLVTEQRCLKCHEDQGYKTGELRGGLSTSCPLNPHLKIANELKRSLAYNHIVIWFVGILGISTSGFFVISKQKQTEMFIENYNAKLENQVKERTEKLEKEIAERITAENELKNATSQLIQSEKMSTIGMLAASIAHEINNPLGAICSSSEIIEKQFSNLVKSIGSELEIYNNNKDLVTFLIDRIPQHKPRLSYRQARELKKEIADNLNKLGTTNAENSADFLLQIGIHENYEDFIPLLNNHNRQELMKLALMISNIIESNMVIDTAIKQSSRVIQVLRDYARSNEDQKAIKANIKETLETALILYGNRIKHGIELLTDFNEVPDITCYPHELCQVWTNIIHNAAQAMDNAGLLTISLKLIENNIVVVISDTGPGIPDDIKDKIFEPLFTTKQKGEGTGLGLDIAKKIVVKHNGSISLHSKSGQGTTFTISIPITESDD